MKKEEMITELKARGVVFKEDATNKDLIELLKATDPKKSGQSSQSTPEIPTGDFIQIKKEEWDKVQEQLKMLYDVADKGRVYNYENQRTEKKLMRVKLSVYNDSYVIGWDMKKDELYKDPLTGKTIGEKQEVGLKLLGKDGSESTIDLIGYSAFSNARYNERIDVDVVGKKEVWKGNQLTEIFDITLPDGKIISIDKAFVN